MPPKKKHPIRITRAGGERAKETTEEDTSAEQERYISPVDQGIVENANADEGSNHACKEG